MEKLLTVAIPAYNVEKYLMKTIPTFLEKDINEYIEILIVNDGSKDDTLKVAKHLEELYPSMVKAIDKENNGHGSAINKAIELATGKYFKVVDGEDWVNTKNFAKLINYLKTNDSDVVLNSFNRVDISQDKVRKIEAPNVEYDKKYSISDIPLENFDKFYQIHSITIKTNILRKIPSITENCFYVDQEYVVYPLLFVETITFLNYDVYQYQVGNQNQSVALKNQQKNIAMLEKVTLNLINYEENNQSSDFISKVMSLRNANMVGNVIRIYLSIGKVSRISCKNFVKEVKDKDISNQIQDFLKRKDAILIFKSNNKLYSILSLIERMGRKILNR